MSSYEEAWPPDIRAFEPGDYELIETRDGAQELWFRDPFGDVGRIAQHTITEHDDGTVTVDPSIADGAGCAESFHGWLRRGIWTW